MDRVDVKVNLKQITKVGENPDFASLDLKGSLLYVEKQGLWRFSRKHSKPKKIGGGGKLCPRREGEKTKLEETNCEGYFHQVAKNTYWGISIGKINTLVKIDVDRREVEAILSSTGEEVPGRGGLFGKSAPIDQKAVLNSPNGPTFLMNGPTGPLLFFYDHFELRVADLTAQSIRMIPMRPYGVILHPNSIRPSAEVKCRASNHIQGSNDRLVANKRITWLASETDPLTYLVDLDTGANAPLFNATLHPLIAISSNLVISIQVTAGGAPWIVLVDWSLPPDLASSPSIIVTSEDPYFLPNDRIKRIAQLPGDAGCSSPFFFDLSSNSLYTPDNIRYLSNIFHIALKTSKDGESIPIYPITSSFGPNLAEKLLVDDCPFPHDIELSHLASGTTWKAHTKILHRHKGLETPEKVDKMAAVIKHSSLPSSSISAFVSLLYFSSPVDPSNPGESFMPVCHCILLCNQIGMRKTLMNYLLGLLDEEVIPELRNAALLKNILTLWFLERDPSPENVATYSESSPLMHLLASECRTFVTESEIRDALNEFELPKNSPLTTSQGIVLGASLVYFLSPKSSIKLLIPHFHGHPPSMAPQLLEWDENLSSSSLVTPNSPYSFIFTIEGLETGGVVCNALLLYAQWKWFEKLIKIGDVELQTRHVAMPTGLTPSALMAILSVPHGTYRPAFTVPSLSSADLANVYRFSSLLELPESPSFAKFVKECKKKLFSAVNERNCIEMLRTFWEAEIEFNSELFLDTLELVVKSSNRNSIAKLLVLPAQLYSVIHAYNADPEAFKSEDFSSFNTAHLYAMNPSLPDK